MFYKTLYKQKYNKLKYYQNINFAKQKHDFYKMYSKYKEKYKRKSQRNLNQYHSKITIIQKNLLKNYQKYFPRIIHKIFLK